MFAVADLVVINKIDLLPYVDVELERLVAHCRSVNPGVAGPAVVGDDRRGHGRVV